MKGIIASLLVVITLITTSCASKSTVKVMTSSSSSSSSSELTSSELSSEIDELQSQIDNLKNDTSKSELSSGSSIVEKNIDLKTLTNKIIEICPPPEGVELTIDTENKSSTFNLDENKIKEHPEEKINPSDITDFVRIYNPNPTKPEEFYHIVIAKINNSELLKIAPYNLYDSLTIILKQMTSSFIYSSDEIPNDPINMYVYDVMTPNNSNEVKDLIKSTINN